MRYGNKIKGFNLFGGYQSIIEKNKERRNSSGRFFASFSLLFYFISVGLTLLIFTGSANAQGFTVQPASIEIDTRARTRTPTVLKIHNFNVDEDIIVDLKVVELTQQQNGDWLPVSIDPCDSFDYHPEIDVSKISSCQSWISLDKKSITVPKNGDASFLVTINTPSRARSGFYGAAILATMKPRTAVTELIQTVVRSGVPVITNINTKALPNKVGITDVGLEFIPSSGTTSGRVMATMKMKNSGVSFPPIKPIIRIRKFQEGHWRLITTHEFSEAGIIPGVELNLKSDIGKSLPSGTYQLDAILYVNGKLAGQNCRFAKQIEFEGDPLLTKAATDVPLDLNPREISISVTPGSTRFGDISIHNATDEQIEVQPLFGIPGPFKGIVGKDNKVVGDAMTCLKWLSFEMNKDKFSLASYGTHNLRIRAEMPENATDYPCYYGAIGLKVIYPDGQNGGTTWVNVCAGNQDVMANTDIECLTINLVEQDAERSEYYVSATFVNNGLTHIVPTRIVAAVAKAGDEFGRTTTMLSSLNYGMLLPYESRTYTGTLNFANIDPDAYNLQVLMEFPPGQKVQKQIQIKVTKVGNKKVPEITEQNVKTTDFVEVKW